jgi:hypothetical protein
MPKQFWNRENTEKSLALLGRLSKEIDFVLIGGWAVYMHTKAQRSEDVDIAIGYDSLSYFSKYGIEEYEGLHIKHTNVEGTVVDLFIEEYADPDLPMPVRDILGNYDTVTGIRVASSEVLVLLKLWGYFRPDEVKRRKDIIDVVSLLFYANMDLEVVRRYISRYRIERRKSTDAMLEYLDTGETLWEFITDTKEEYARLKERAKRDIKKAFHQDMGA